MQRLKVSLRSSKDIQPLHAGLWQQQHYHQEEITFEHSCCAWSLQQTLPHVENKQKPWAWASPSPSPSPSPSRFTCNGSLWEGRSPNTPSYRLQVQQSSSPFAPAPHHIHLVIIIFIIFLLMSMSYRYHNEQFFAKIFLSNSTESWTMLSALWKNFFQRSPYQLTLCFWCLSFGLSGKRYARNVEFILKWNLLIFFLIIVDRKKAPEHSWYRAQLAIIRWEVKLLTLESEPGTTSCSPEISKKFTKCEQHSWFEETLENTQ